MYIIYLSGLVCSQVRVRVHKRVLSKSGPKNQVNEGKRVQRVHMYLSRKQNMNFDNESQPMLVDKVKVINLMMLL